ncbi:hypothetical protein [Agarilytica rhodophyticola]|uniref:hypothetical protein n=1 Tax=Agarilytica rhodophyticola TaxID=1737490 RepID=UPI000B342C44|nr:hypothetical protein [Agarilytica rhodophyticola]
MDISCAQVKVKTHITDQQEGVEHSESTPRELVGDNKPLLPNSYETKIYKDIDALKKQISVMNKRLDRLLHFDGDNLTHAIHSALTRETLRKRP